MRIAITWHDIKTGIRASSHSCPIARALNRRGFPAVSVTPGAVTIKNTDDKWSASFRLSDKATEFIDDFDYGRDVKPFTIILRGLDA